MNRFIDRILNDRIKSLIWAGVLGILLAIIAYIAAGYLCNKILQSSITLLFLGLPTFFALWVFRTHDVQEQLKKAEEQLKRTEENTNNSAFFECARLLATKDSPKDPNENVFEDPDKKRIKDSLPKKIALEQLAYLRRKTSFDKKKIDLLTKDLSLSDKEFSHAQLRGLDLSGADLRGTTLINADLSGAQLIDADLRILRLERSPLQSHLSTTDLSHANLKDANLFGTKLEGCLYNSKTIFTGTVLDSEEVREAAGMIYQPDGEDPKNK